MNIYRCIFFQIAFADIFVPGLQNVQACLTEGPFRTRDTGRDTETAIVGFSAEAPSLQPGVQRVRQAREQTGREAGRTGAETAASASPRLLFFFF